MLCGIIISSIERQRSVGTLTINSLQLIVNSFSQCVAGQLNIQKCAIYQQASVQFNMNEK